MHIVVKLLRSAFDTRDMNRRNLQRLVQVFQHLIKHSFSKNALDSKRLLSKVIAEVTGRQIETNSSRQIRKTTRTKEYIKPSVVVKAFGSIRIVDSSSAAVQKIYKVHAHAYFAPSKPFHRELSLANRKLFVARF